MSHYQNPPSMEVDEEKGEEDHCGEIQLLSPPHARRASPPFDSHPPAKSLPSLDLQLSISVGPRLNNFGKHTNSKDVRATDAGPVEALRWEAAEQIRLAVVERAYAESVRELTRREMEAADHEFARARTIWERAREEVERAERMKERMARELGSACVEITCQSCWQKFRP